METAVVNRPNRDLSFKDRGEVTVLVLLDLSNAFDTTTMIFC